MMVTLSCGRSYPIETILTSKGQSNDFSEVLFATGKSVNRLCMRADFQDQFLSMGKMQLSVTTGSYLRLFNSSLHFSHQKKSLHVNGYKICRPLQLFPKKCMLIREAWLCLIFVCFYDSSVYKPNMS